MSDYGPYNETYGQRAWSNLEDLRKALHIFYELPNERDETLAEWCRRYHSDLYATDDYLHSALQLLEDQNDVLTRILDQADLPEDLERDARFLKRVYEED